MGEGERYAEFPPPPYQRTGDVLTARIEGHMGDREQAMDWRFDKAELNTRCPNP